MDKEKQIEEMTIDIHKSPWKLEQDCRGANINAEQLAEYFYKVGYRKQCEVIDEFAKRLIDAFPEASPNHRSPCLYYDEYRYIIEELAEELKVCEK